MRTKYTVVNKDRAFTLTTLTELINKKYKKPNGSAYTCSDIKKYSMRGHLPAYMGGHGLKNVELEDTGIKYIEVTEPIGVRGRSVQSGAKLFD